MKRVISKSLFLCYISIIGNLCAETLPAGAPNITLPGQVHNLVELQKKPKTIITAKAVKPSSTVVTPGELLSNPSNGSQETTTVSESPSQQFSVQSENSSTPKLPDKKMTDQEMKKLSDEQIPPPYIAENFMTITTGAVNGVYYPAGAAICRMVNMEAQGSDIRCAVNASDGSAANIAHLRDATASFGIVQSDLQEYAFDGVGQFSKNGPFENLRFVFALHNEALTIIVRKHDNIKHLSDLQGKIINAGAELSPVRTVFDRLMAIEGWPPTTFKSLTKLSPDEQIEALCNKRIDAMVLLVGHPNAIVQDAVNMCEVEILNIDDATIRDFIKKNQEYTISTIPGGLYVGQPDDVHALGVVALLLATTDTSMESVYRVTKSVFGNLDTFKKLNPVFMSLTAHSMLNDGRAIPIHPGAMKYYEEQNYIK